MMFMQMIALYKDPLGENIFTQNTVQQASSLGVEAVVNKEKIHKSTCKRP